MAAPTEVPYTLVITSMEGNEVQLIVTDSLTISTLKELLETATGISPHRQSLSLIAISLSDEKTLREYEISSTSRLTLRIAAPTAISEVHSFALQLFFITLATFSSSLILTQFHPYISKMVMSFNLADRTTVGFYTGLITGGLMTSRAVSSPIWGYVTDTWGRKPVLLVSLFFCVLTSITFGLSTNLTMAVASRISLGLFVPIIIVTKTCISEVCPDYYQNRGMAWYSTARHLGAILGYFTGAALESPTTGPKIFIDYPFLLPNVLCAGVSLISFIGIALWMDETLPVKQGEALLPDSPEEATYSVLLHDPVFQLILCLYAINSFLSSGYFELIPLWCWAKREDGGLELNPKEIGYTAACSTCLLVLIQQVVYSALVDRKGLRWMCLYNTLWLIPVTVATPFLSYFPADYLLLLIMLITAQLLWLFLDFQILTAQFSIVNNCVTKRQRGKANGVGMTVGSIGRALAPPVLSTCFALSAPSGFFWPLNFTCAFNIMAILSLLMWMYSRQLPGSIEKTKDSLLDGNM